MMVIVTVSGGLDSLVALALLKASGVKIRPFMIDQGIKSHVYAATLICQHYELELDVHDFSSTFARLKRCGTNYYAGYRAYSYLTALALADTWDANCVYTGELDAVLASEDANNDPDYQSWLKHLNVGDRVSKEGWHSARQKFAGVYNYMYQNDEDGITFIDPLFGMDKPSVIRLGATLNAPLEYSLSCRASDVDEINDNLTAPRHCGRHECWTCNQRKSAFKLSGVKDPTQYSVAEEIGGLYKEYLNAKS